MSVVRRVVVRGYGVQRPQLYSRTYLPGTNSYTGIPVPSYRSVVGTVFECVLVGQVLLQICSAVVPTYELSERRWIPKK